MTFVAGTAFGKRVLSVVVIVSHGVSGVGEEEENEIHLRPLNSGFGQDGNLCLATKKTISMGGPWG